MGVLDSGVGGLTVLQALMEREPNRRYIYLADTAWMPYGYRSATDIRHRVQRLYQLLRHTYSIRQLVLACNTASASLPLQCVLGSMREKAPTLLDIIQPTVDMVLEQVCSPKARVALMATTTTVQTRRYDELMHYYEAPFTFASFPCPGLARAIEGVSQHPLEQVLQEDVGPVKAWQPDYVILGSTHYLHAQAAIQKLLGSGVTLLNPATAIVERIVERDRLLDAWQPVAAEGFRCGTEDNNPGAAPHHLLLTTGHSEAFEATAQRLVPQLMAQLEPSVLTLPPSLPD